MMDLYNGFESNACKTGCADDCLQFHDRIKSRLLWAKFKASVTRSEYVQKWSVAIFAFKCCVKVFLRASTHLLDWKAEYTLVHQACPDPSESRAQG